MEINTSSALQALDAATLTPFVRQALRRDNIQILDWQTSQLGGGAGNPVSVGLYRCEGIGQDRDERTDAHFKVSGIAQRFSVQPTRLDPPQRADPTVGRHIADGGQYSGGQTRNAVRHNRWARTKSRGAVIRRQQVDENKPARVEIPASDQIPAGIDLMQYDCRMMSRNSAHHLPRSNQSSMKKDEYKNDLA